MWLFLKRHHPSFNMTTTLCVVLNRPTESAQLIETGWPPLHPMTADVKTRTRMTPLSRWYHAPAVLSCTTLCRSAWLNTRTGVCARATSRLSKTAWWISKLHKNNSWWSSISSSQPPASLHPAELTRPSEKTAWLNYCSENKSMIKSSPGLLSVFVVVTRVWKCVTVHT